MQKKYNILFFFADDMRFNTINALGNDEIITPNLDKLVKEGVSFTHAHIPCGTSGAVCMPSRAMLHSGRTLFHLKGEGQTIPSSHQTLGETLIKSGYRTFGTGKWHNGTEAYARSFTDGAEIFFGGMEDHWNVPAHNFDPTGEYSERTKKIRDPFKYNKETINICDHVTPGKHSTELFGEATMSFIDNYDSEDPFFAYLAFMAPHDPRSMPERFKDMYKIDNVKLPENYREMFPFDYGIYDCRDEVLAPYPREEMNTREQILEYYAMITHLDDELGKVISHLDDKGLRDNTIIIFAADNGLAVGQHGLFGKQNHYEHSIRVPFVIAGPGIPKDERRDAYIYLLDIYPTICDLLGIEAPESVEGISFKDIIFGSDKKTRENLYFAYNDQMRGVKDDRFKLIEYLGNGTDVSEMFDLKNDPLEMKNIIDDEEYEEEKKKLQNIMFELRDEWEDEGHRYGKSFWNRYREIR